MNPKKPHKITLEAPALAELIEEMLAKFPALRATADEMKRERGQLMVVGAGGGEERLTVEPGARAAAEARAADFEARITTAARGLMEILGVPIIQNENPVSLLKQAMVAVRAIQDEAKRQSVQWGEFPSTVYRLLGEARDTVPAYVLDRLKQTVDQLGFVRGYLGVRIDADPAPALRDKLDRLAFLETAHEVQGSQRVVLARLLRGLDPYQVTPEDKEFGQYEAHTHGGRLFGMARSVMDDLHRLRIKVPAADAAIETANELARVTVERDQYKEELRVELDGRDDLRREFGARDNETFPDFVGRLARERKESMDVSVEILALAERSGKRSHETPVEFFNRLANENALLRAEQGKCPKCRKLMACACGQGIGV